MTNIDEPTGLPEAELVEQSDNSPRPEDGEQPPQAPDWRDPDAEYAEGDNIPTQSEDAPSQSEGGE